MRAVSLPYLVGAVLFLVAIVVAVCLVLMQPHAPDSIDSGAIGSNDDAWVSEGAGADSTSNADPLGSGAGGAGTAGVAGTDGDGSPGSEARVYVHVVGEVRNPGVVELAEGSRVEQAIAAAGGATQEAMLAGVNLARVVTDGEQIVVPDALGSGAASVDPESAGGAGVGSDGTVNINLADTAALDTLPGVGPALAQRIIDWRTANNGFQSVDQLLEVSGIGNHTLEQLRGRVRV